MIRIEAYQCEYCDKIYKSINGCKRHEKQCFANHKLRACRSCKHAIKQSETVYVRPQGEQKYGDADYEVEEIYCKITDKLLHRQGEKLKNFEHGCNYHKQGERLF